MLKSSNGKSLFRNKVTTKIINCIQYFAFGLQILMKPDFEVVERSWQFIKPPPILTQSL